MKRALILCTGNSCRSQMAEGLWNRLGRGQWEALGPAGSKPAGFVHPFAVCVMQEIGIDIGAHVSKSVEEFAQESFDLVVTVCDHAKDACPVFPNAKEMLHWPFPDPAHATGTNEDQLAVFRTIRDRISEKIESFLQQNDPACGLAGK